jgi:hypothetical protein
MGWAKELKPDNLAIPRNEYFILLDGVPEVVSLVTSCYLVKIFPKRAPWPILVISVSEAAKSVRVMVPHMYERHLITWSSRCGSVN